MVVTCLILSSVHSAEKMLLANCVLLLLMRYVGMSYGLSQWFWKRFTTCVAVVLEVESSPVSLEQQSISTRMYCLLCTVLENDPKIFMAMNSSRKLFLLTVNSQLRCPTWVSAARQRLPCCWLRIIFFSNRLVFEPCCAWSLSCASVRTEASGMSNESMAYSAKSSFSRLLSRPVVFNRDIVSVA